MKYRYSKIINSDKLTSEIRASSLANTLWYIETNSGVVDIYTNVELTADQEAALGAIVSAHVPNIDPTTAITNKILSSMAFGQLLMAQFGALNVLAGLTTAQVKQLMEITSKLQAAVLSGSLYVALDEIADLSLLVPIYDAADGTTVIATGENITLFRNKIQTYLGIPLS